MVKHQSAVTWTIRHRLYHCKDFVAIQFCPDKIFAERGWDQGGISSVQFWGYHPNLTAERIWGWRNCCPTSHMWDACHWVLRTFVILIVNYIQIIWMYFKRLCFLESRVNYDYDA